VTLREFYIICLVYAANRHLNRHLRSDKVLGVVRRRGGCDRGGIGRRPPPPTGTRHHPRPWSNPLRQRTLKTPGGCDAEIERARCHPALPRNSEPNHPPQVVCAWPASPSHADRQGLRGLRGIECLEATGRTSERGHAGTPWGAEGGHSYSIHAATVGHPGKGLGPHPRKQAVAFTSLRAFQIATRRGKLILHVKVKLMLAF
jgi:hypothetical protein